MEGKCLKLLNFAPLQLPQACGLCGGWTPEKPFPSRGEEEAPAPKLAAPIQAKGKLPPDVNPVKPVRQCNKQQLTLHIFTRKLITLFFSN